MQDNSNIPSEGGNDPDNVRIPEELVLRLKRNVLWQILKFGSFDPMRNDDPEAIEANPERFRLRLAVTLAHLMGLERQEVYRIQGELLANQPDP